MSRIPQTFIDELIARADIVDVVGSRVALKKAGRDYKGLCPFHNEKTPSFTVSPSKGFFHCFGCGANGTALGFLMRYDNLGFREAVEALAEMVGLPVPEVARTDPQPTDDGLIPLLHEADQLYRRHLRETPKAIEYLKRRGIDGATAGRFGLGYAPDAWDTVLKALGRGDEKRIARLLEAGLLVRGESGRVYDRFRDRIMFPIRNARGDVIGFGGRVIGAGEPKYLNSPESPVFHKGRELYGLFEARGTPGRPAEILVVEGYLDVASLAQFGVGPAVATLGTSTTADHVRRLTRLSDRVIFCFDGDHAGRKAAWRALETVLPFAGGKVEIKFLLLPEGEDPDSLVRGQGPEAFRRLMAEALPLSTFLIEELATRIDTKDVDGRARLVAEAKPLLARIPAGVYRELLIEELARLTGIEQSRFVALLEPQAAAPTRDRPAAPPPPRKGRSAIGRTITLVLHHPGAVALAGEVAGLDEVDEPGAALLRRVLELARERPDLKLAGLIERFRDDPDERHIVRLAAEEPPLVEDDTAAAAVLRDALERIVRDHAVAARKREQAEALRRARLGADGRRNLT
ncbi:MAG: DNA primase [Gammaproteobacteria bacterium]|nr:DNA primase [Gammaproteobacteria bacterium]